MHWGFGEEKKEERGRLATDISSGPIFLTKKRKKTLHSLKKKNKERKKEKIVQEVHWVAEKCLGDENVCLI